MRVYDIIMKKKQGKELSEAEIDFLIKGFTAGDIPDYQMAAWLMAVNLKGMTAEETVSLTTSMANSGEILDLSPIRGKKIDKHSTGGVGDTTTLILAPLVAAAGVPVAKISGRGLGHTGGTLDKLESIPEFNINLSKEQFFEQVNRIKLAVISQSEQLAPADKKIYSLRDVTATIDSIPLIASSIMSKKIAAGADAIVLDVKCGNGAFMESISQAKELARCMVSIGKKVGLTTIALITDMEQPLGNYIGNALEVKEAIEILKGEGNNDLKEVSLLLGAYMLLLAGRVSRIEDGKTILEEIIHQGKACHKMKEWISAQGGKPEVVDDPQLLPHARFTETISSEEEGYIYAIYARKVGEVAMTLGAGRRKKDDLIDLSCGIELKKRRGQKVSLGEPMAIIYGNDPLRIKQAIEMLKEAIIIKKEAPSHRPLIHDIIES